VQRLPEPNRRELELGRWAHGDDEPRRLRHSLHLSCYREELLRPFDAMLEDYASLGDTRVVDDLKRILETARGMS
jgi:hypothetical protein